MLVLLLTIILGIVSCEQCKDNNGNIIENCCTSDDEVYKECGTACQPTCDTQFPICSMLSIYPFISIIKQTKYI